MGLDNFCWAIMKLLAGKKLVRQGWNNPGMWVEVQWPDDHSKMSHPYIFMNIPGCKEGHRRLPWQPSQVDMFTADWYIK